MTRVKAILGAEEVVALIRHVCDEAKVMTNYSPCKAVGTNIVNYAERLRELGELLYATCDEARKET